MKVHSVLSVALTVALAVCSAARVSAQQSTPAVPTLVKYSGTLAGADGKPLTSIVGVTFRLYKDEQGGAPLWMETQNVTPDQAGRYSVMLGSTRGEGLPTDLFASGEARWLAVQIQGQAEQPRVLLLSVPYAMKAGDAATLGGLPPSAFALAAPVNGVVTTAESDGSATKVASVAPPTSSTVTTTGGTVNAIPLFTTATNIQNSILTQSGTTTINLAGKLILPSTGTATAGKGDFSQPLDFVGSAFNSGTSTAVNQKFQLQVEPTGNDTTTTAGTLNFLYGSGTAAPAETGLKINSKGVLVFATGQTFPGAGTLTGITTASGSGLTGGGTSGALALSLLSTCTANQILKWSGTAWACSSDANSGGTIKGVTAGTDLTGGGTTGTVTLNVDTTKVPQLSANNTFTGTQTIKNDVSISSGSGYALSVTATGNNDAFTASTAWASGYASIGAATSTTGSGGGVLGTSAGPTGVGVTGSAVSSATNAAGVGVQGTSSSDFGVGVYGGGYGAHSTGVRGVFSSASTVAEGSCCAGVWGDTTRNVGVLGTSDSNYGIVGASSTSYGVFGQSSSDYGVVGYSSSNFGVTGFGPSNVGVYGVYGGSSNSGTGAAPAGVWGDSYLTGGFAVLGTADDGNAYWGKNNSGSNETLYLENDHTTNGSDNTAVARFAGPGAATYCEIYQDSVSHAGDFLCTGSKSAAVPIEGNRMVRMYAVEAADNWFEDAGGAQLANGGVSVRLEREFAQTINGDVDYRVFLTPNGDCEGLYVANKTAQGFEVRELHGGHSNVAFDYRIMAKRKGYENARMEDVTARFEQHRRQAERMQAEMAARKAVKPQLPTGLGLRKAPPHAAPLPHPLPVLQTTVAGSRK
jgi:hypothetical protein